jgi:hypothetical protein
MKLRWSNNTNYAVEFYANTPDEMVANGMVALKKYREHEYRRIHRGEIHKTQNLYGKANLHVLISANRWTDGCTLIQGTLGTGASYRQYSLPGGYYDLDKLGLLLAHDEMALTIDAAQLFDWMRNALHYSEAFNEFLYKKLPELLDNCGDDND